MQLPSTFDDNKKEVPFKEPLPGLYQLMPLSNTFPPINRTNCFLIGDAGGRIFMVDPSPKDDSEYKKLINTLRRKKLTYTDIFITHHHSDHHTRATLLARDFSLPITMSEITYNRILNRKGNSYFGKTKIKFTGEGDILTRWQGREVKVYEVPGHDNGQLALAPDNMAWFLVGDLIQNMGTVVIPRDEGDMIKYFESLRRVIRLSPGIILPSHGMAKEGTSALEKTLSHRLQREKQVMQFHLKGKTAKDMVRIIYRNVDKGLWPLALENIESHLEKLRREKKIT
ncbi:MAG: MBL fold metallo-hydrolase [bacterium]|nr:MBL fold metallo-hydrolase [bacterium]